ncbi:hypothetical protein D3C76_882790 [compost metagenome]
MGAANQLQIEPLGPQIGLQCLCGLLPLRLQLAMVEQADAQLAGLGGEVVYLEQLAAQHRVRTQSCQQHRHQPVDEQAGGGEAVDPDDLLGGLGIHAVEEVIPLVPDAELGAHPVVLGGGGMDLKRGRIEVGEQLGEAIALLVELGLVVGGGPLGLGHRYLRCTPAGPGRNRGKAAANQRVGILKGRRGLSKFFVVKKWSVGPITDPPVWRESDDADRWHGRSPTQGSGHCSQIASTGRVENGGQGG